MEDEQTAMKNKNKDKRAEPPDVQETPAQEVPCEEAPAQEAAPCENWQEKYAQAQALADEYLAMAQRVQADFDNFRRRNQSVRAESFEDGARALLKTLLPTLDNLERALAAETTDEKLHEGVQLSYKQLFDALQKRGVTVIDRLGEKFDPNLENAVLQGTPEEGEPGSVCCVLQKGYKLGDYVLRHAMVKVVPA